MQSRCRNQSPSQSPSQSRSRDDDHDDNDSAVDDGGRWGGWGGYSSSDDGHGELSCADGHSYGANIDCGDDSNSNSAHSGARFSVDAAETELAAAVQRNRAAFVLHSSGRLETGDREPRTDSRDCEQGKAPNDCEYDALCDRGMWVLVGLHMPYGYTLIAQGSRECERDSKINMNQYSQSQSSLSHAQTQSQPCRELHQQQQRSRWWTSLSRCLSRECRGTQGCAHSSPSNNESHSNSNAIRILESDTHSDCELGLFEALEDYALWRLVHSKYCNKNTQTREGANDGANSEASAMN